LDLLKAGRAVPELAHDLQISDQTIYNWRRQDLIDTGQLAGVTSTDQAELVAARRRIAELETELAVHRRATELLKEAVPPKGRYAAIKTMAAEGLPVEVCCRVLDVSVSGYYAWRTRPLSARALRHAWLTEQIRAVHLASRGTYGSRRVHAELTLGRGILVGYHAVEMLMHRGRHPWPAGQPAATAEASDADGGRLGQPRLHPRGTEPVVGHRHHRAPDPRGQGLLRGGARLLLPQGRRLVDRLDADRHPGHQRTGHGDQ
jgi:transposase-like protein